MGCSWRSWTVTGYYAVFFELKVCTHRILNALYFFPHLRPAAVTESTMDTRIARPRDEELCRTLHCVGVNFLSCRVELSVIPENSSVLLSPCTNSALLWGPLFPVGGGLDIPPLGPRMRSGSPERRRFESGGLKSREPG